MHFILLCTYACVFFSTCIFQRFLQSVFVDSLVFQIKLYGLQHTPTPYRIELCTLRMAECVALSVHLHGFTF